MGGVSSPSDVRRAANSFSRLKFSERAILMGTQPKWHTVLPLLFLGVAIPFDDPTFSSSQKTTFASASLASLTRSSVLWKWRPVLAAVRLRSHGAARRVWHRRKGTLLKKFVQEECSSSDFDFVGRFLVEYDSCSFESTVTKYEHFLGAR